jgi:transposase InsO family protein
VIERVLSDNNNCYRSHAWAAACTELAIARRYTRPRERLDTIFG